MNIFKWDILGNISSEIIWSSGTSHTGSLASNNQIKFNSSGYLYADIEVLWKLSTYYFVNPVESIRLYNRMNGLGVYLSYPGERIIERYSVPYLNNLGIPNSYIDVGNKTIGYARGRPDFGNNFTQLCCATGYTYLSRIPLFPSGEHILQFGNTLELESPILTITTGIKIYTLKDA